MAETKNPAWYELRMPWAIVAEHAKNAGELLAPHCASLQKLTPLIPVLGQLETLLKAGKVAPVERLEANVLKLREKISGATGGIKLEKEQVDALNLARNHLTLIAALLHLTTMSVQPKETAESELSFELDSATKSASHTGTGTAILSEDELTLAPDPESNK